MPQGRKHALGDEGGARLALKEEEGGRGRIGRTSEGSSLPGHKRQRIGGGVGGGGPGAGSVPEGGIGLRRGQGEVAPAHASAPRMHLDASGTHPSGTAHAHADVSAQAGQWPDDVIPASGCWRRIRVQAHGGCTASSWHTGGGPGASGNSESGIGVPLHISCTVELDAPPFTPFGASSASPGQLSDPPKGPGSLPSGLPNGANGVHPSNLAKGTPGVHPFLGDKLGGGKITAVLEAKGGPGGGVAGGGDSRGAPCGVACFVQGQAVWRDRLGKPVVAMAGSRSGWAVSCADGSLTVRLPPARSCYCRLEYCMIVQKLLPLMDGCSSHCTSLFVCSCPNMSLYMSLDMSL